ncbi:hypothetical protein [Streptomyces fuscichromogenes]|uniref:Uncharacterized protein n=1 Tax=Streptomyces fuscichromogenes TaxID=1324013 RepID=A0A918CXG7_9ACTN|nr:hypothetical protein [Streptomyces fuscichromogenes]GGN44205.1 hypothetical protein GCM10011578_094950 [Streptomyces fuscichromogenes]
MTEPPAQASGRVATGRSEGDAYPLPPGLPLARAERPGVRHGPRTPGPTPADARLPLYATPSE